MRDSHSTQQQQRAQRKRSAGAVIGLAGILILTGCTTDTSPTPPPVSSISTTTSSIPTVTAPPSTAAPATAAAYQPATANGPAQNVPVRTLPAKAKEFSKDGLLAFAQYWYSTLGYAFETGDPGPMMAITEPDCTTCANINGPVGKWYAKGGWIVGGLMTAHSSTSSFEEDSDGTYQAIVMVQQSPATYYEPDQTLYKAYPPTIARADIVVATFQDGLWRARTAERLTKD